MNWIDEELAEIERKREEALKNKNLLPFLKLEVGENVIEFTKEKPLDNPKFAGRKLFRVVKDGVDYYLSIGQNSSLYRDILKYLKDNKTKLKIIRIGKGINDTRYTVFSV